MATPRLAKNFCAIRFSNFIRAVRDLVVNGYDDFCGPAVDAVECAADAVVGLNSRRISFEEDVSARVLLACG